MQPNSRPFDLSRASDIPTNNGLFDDLIAQEEHDHSQAATSHTLAAMLSGARSLTPMLEAVVFQPGLAASQHELADAVQAMISSAREIAEHAMKTMAIDDVPDKDWAKAMLMQLATGGIAEQWKTHGHADSAPWLNIIDNLIDAGVTQRTREYPDVNDQTAYQVSHFAALSTVASEVRQFSFFYDPTALLERLSVFLDQKVSDATEFVLEGVQAGDADRVMVEQGLLRHASGLFAEIYRERAEQTVNEVSRMGADERQHFVRNGGPADRVETVRRDFDQLFSALTQESRQRAAHSTERNRQRSTPTLS